MSKVDVLSCIQPTGEMHIGNYFGAVRNWVDLQAKGNCIYGIVDLHAMTGAYAAADLRRHTDQMIVDLLACGIDPRRSILFVQSLVPEHVELSWILGTIARYEALAAQKQFMAKQADKSNKEISAGLFNYPLLQAADILIYKPKQVPIGNDQAQHLELCQKLADKFNEVHGNILLRPEAKFTETPQIKSLLDPSRKMSKSLGDEHNIKLFESEQSIRNKVGRADTTAAGMANLVSILNACKKDPTISVKSADHDSAAEMKTAVADALVELTTRLTDNRAEVMRDTSLINDAIREMSIQARAIARETLFQVKDKVGVKSLSNF